MPVVSRSRTPIWIAGDLYLDREPALLVPYSDAFPNGDWVYFVGPTDRATVKIGTTYTVYERVVKQIQAQHVIPLALFALEPGDHVVERSFHERFAAYRLHGEIFDVTGDLAAWLDEEAVPEPLQLLRPGRDISMDQNAPEVAARLARNHAHVQAEMRTSRPDIRPPRHNTAAPGIHPGPTPRGN